MDGRDLKPCIFHIRRFNGKAKKPMGYVDPPMILGGSDYKRLRVQTFVVNPRCDRDVFCLCLLGPTGPCQFQSDQSPLVLNDEIINRKWGRHHSDQNTWHECYVAELRKTK